MDNPNPTPRQKREAAARNLERVQRERAEREHAEREAPRREAAARVTYLEREAERFEQLGYPEQAAACRRAANLPRQLLNAHVSGALARGEGVAILERRPPVRVPDPGRGLTTEQGLEAQIALRHAELVQDGGRAA